MKYTYDPVADAVNIVFKEGEVKKSQELSNGIVLDLDKKGVPLYLEILDASRHFKQKTNYFKKMNLKSFKYSKRDIRKLIAVK